MGFSIDPVLSLLGLKAAAGIQGGPAPGYGQDIPIPNLSGRIDPRLPIPSNIGTVDVGSHLQQSGEGLKQLWDRAAQLKQKR